MSDTTMIEAEKLRQANSLADSDHLNQTSKEEQQAVAYLGSNPDFFQKHPELLTDLTLTTNGTRDTQSAASSLLVKQVSALRERNVELDQRLKEMMHIAQENESLLEQTFQLSLNLSEASSLDDFFQALVSGLKENFNIEHLHINLLDESFLPTQHEETHISLVDIAKAETYFNTLLGRSNIFCGVLRDKEINFLFPNQAEYIRSAALILLAVEKPVGMIALGSSDALHFQAKYGQTFLTQIQKMSDLMLNKLKRMNT